MLRAREGDPRVHESTGWDATARLRQGDSSEEATQALGMTRALGSLGEGKGEGFIVSEHWEWPYSL
jgi:hypothetical protein